MRAAKYTRPATKAVSDAKCIAVDLGWQGQARVWTCDLTPGYIDITAAIAPDGAWTPYSLWREDAMRRRSSSSAHVHSRLSSQAMGLAASLERFGLGMAVPGARGKSSISARGGDDMDFSKRASSPMPQAVPKAGAVMSTPIWCSANAGPDRGRCCGRLRLRHLTGWPMPDDAWRRGAGRAVRKFFFSVDSRPQSPS